MLKRTYSELQEQWSFNLQPKQTIICEAQAKKAELVKRTSKTAVQAKKSVR